MIHQLMKTETVAPEPQAGLDVARADRAVMDDRHDGSALAWDCRLESEHCTHLGLEVREREGVVVGIEGDLRPAAE